VIPLLGGAGRRRSLHHELVEASPLRRFDARAKLAVSLCTSLAVMSSWLGLVIFIVIFSIFLAWARLLPHAARQVWRLKWVLLFLFVLDWLVIGLDLAITISLRVVVLACAFILFFATTSPGELCLALEQLHVPYRYAFSISLAYQSLELLSQEWRGIREAQRARGIWSPATGWRQLVASVRDLVGLTVPAIVLTAKRAWAITEAAYARGFDSPRRRPYRQPVLHGRDWLLVLGAVAVAAALLWWR
jgi:energy-coupling factor transporter transmembrane protein EcfT